MKILKLNRDSIVHVAWIIMIIYMFAIGRSSLKNVLPASEIKQVCTYLAIALLIFKICLFSRYSINKIVLVLLLFALIVAVTINSKSLNLPAAFLFIVASSDIDIRKLVLVDMRTKILVLAFLYFLSVIGIVSSYSLLINGAMKYSFGWGHPNTFCGTVVVVIMEWLYLSWEKISFKHYLIAGLALLFLYKYAASRTTIYAALSVIIWIYCTKSGFKLVDSRLFHFIYRWIVLIMAGVSWLAVALYMQGSNIGRMLNSILTSRLAWSTKFLVNYGISLWGKDIETVSSRQAKLTGEAMNIFDMAFIRIFVEYGIVYSMFYIIAFYYIGKYLAENNKKAELLLLLYFSIIGIGSYSSISVFSNFLLLLSIPCIVYSRKPKQALNLMPVPKYYAK